MSGASNIIRAIKSATYDDRLALIGFLTAGYPSPEQFITDFGSVSLVADVVEIGVPFSDPMADGVSIQRASHKALSNGVTLSWILEVISCRENSNVPVLLMSYLNPLLAYGLDKLTHDAQRSGVAGFIVPDLPLEECEDFSHACEQHELALVQLVTPLTNDVRLRALCEKSAGFVYAVTHTGITGDSVTIEGQTLAYIDRVRRMSQLPVCAGFGIRSPQQLSVLKGRADGAIVGSALIDARDRGIDPGAYLRGLIPADGI